MKARFFGIFIVICLLPWIIVQPQIRLNGDPVWLVRGAEQMAAGHSMVDTYYDTAPPLCFIVYLPVVALERAGLPLWWALMVFVSALAALALVLNNAVLKNWVGLMPSHRWGLLAAIAAGGLLPAQYEFGQKDQLIAIMLPVFLLAQVTLIERPPAQRRWLHLAMAVAVPFVLMKPHYGLLPALLVLCRLWREKKISSLLRFDVIALGAGLLIYGAVVFLFFPDFISPIMSDIAHFYASSLHEDVYKASAGMALMGGALLIFALCAGDENPDAKRLAVFLSAGALVAVIPFFAQLKGFSYQMLPVIALLVSAVFMTGSLYIPKFGSRPAGGAVLAVFVLAYLAFPPAFFFPRHADYKNTPLARLIEEKATGSSFFMESSYSYMIAPIGIYTGIPYASRFMNLWFVTDMVAARQRGAFSCKDNGENPCHRFARYVAEDLAKYRPAIVLLFDHPVPENDTLGVFAGDKNFAREWARYRRDGIFTLRYRDYSNGRFKIDNLVVDYDIWVRDDARPGGARLQSRP